MSGCCSRGSAAEQCSSANCGPRDVRRFIAEQLEALNTNSNALTIASALRAYLRYRASCGDAVQPLLAVISSPAHWSLASLPRALDARARSSGC